MCYFWSRVYLSLSLSFSHHVCVNPVEMVCCFWRSAEFFSQVDNMSNSLTDAVDNFKVLKWKNVSYAVFAVCLLQALYFCVPFRDQLLEYCGQNNKMIGDTEENLLTCLSELFTQVRFCSFGPMFMQYSKGRHSLCVFFLFLTCGYSLRSCIKEISPLANIGSR